MLQHLVLASNNAGKLREFSTLLAQLGIQNVQPQGALQVPEVNEPYGTFIENALHKARHASHLTGLPALADDSGLCVDTLNGAPGVLSARFAGREKSDAANTARLLTDLAHNTARRAHYYCVLVLVRHANDPQPIIADGLWHGEILATPQGTGGFGYDPVFWLPQQQCSVAELSAEEKNRLSHRAQAMARLSNMLREFSA